MPAGARARLWWAATLGVALAAMLARLAAARGELWLDEIWSLELAKLVRSPLDVLTAIHHDNNHHLNTLWLWLAGPGRSSLTYRLLALAASLGLLAPWALRAPSGGSSLRFSTTLLLGSSWLLVHYGSEARGYAPALASSVAAYQALGAWLATGRRRWALATAGAATLGLVSHLSSLYALAGLAAWSALALAGQGRGRVRDRAALAVLALPLLAFAALWLVDLRHLVVGGGPKSGLGEALRELLRTTLGLPRGPLEALGAGALVLAAFAIRALRRAGDPRWVFFAATFLAPFAVLLVVPPSFLAPRYFLVTVPFLLILCARHLEELPAAVRLLFLAGFAVASAFPVTRLARDGRGHYQEAIRFMREHTRGSVVTVGSEHDFRNPMVLAYYLERLDPPGRFYYVTDGVGVEPPLWYLRSDPSGTTPAASVIAGPRGRPYRLATRFPAAYLSGWQLLVYGRVD